MSIVSGVSTRIRNPTRGQSQYRQATLAKFNKRRIPYVYSEDGPFRIEAFADPENLHYAFRQLEKDGGRASGVDGVTYAELSPSEVYVGLRCISHRIRNRAYRVGETRTVSIPKGDGRFRELRLPTILDRAVGKALHLALEPALKQELRFFGLGTLRLYAQLGVAMNKTKKYVLAVDDIRDCFPNANLSTVLQAFETRFRDNNDLIGLIESCIRRDADNNTTGLIQGSPFSPLAMELLLHTRLDQRLTTERPRIPSLFRYADNLSFPCRDEREGLGTLKVVKELLADIGLKLKGKDGDPQDTRDPKYDHVVLGMIPKWKNGRFLPELPGKAFNDLDVNLREAWNSSCPPDVAKQKVKGWLDAVGPTLTKAVEKDQIDQILEIATQNGFREIPRNWLRNRMKASRKNWMKLQKEAEEQYQG